MHSFAVASLNTATQEQLETLNGICPVKTQTILESRKKNGNFKTVDDLNNVPGIVDKTFVKLKPELTVSGSAPATATTIAKPAVKNNN